MRRRATGLRHYRYEVETENDQPKFSPKPLHDENSHAADAFRGLAMSLQPKRERPKVYERPVYGGATGWMG
jgi:phage terminase large subunit